MYNSISSDLYITIFLERQQANRKADNLDLCHQLHALIILNSHERT